MPDHFPLAHFESVLDKFRPPAEAFDPTGAWVNAYDVWECSQGAGVYAVVAAIGALRIERTPLGTDRARLQVRYRKRAAGGILRAEMTLECRGDELATPIRWRAETVVHDAEDKPVEDLRLRETGEVGERGLRVRVGGMATRVPVAGPFTFGWSLLDAVQRLGGEGMQPLDFTLIDRLNHQVKPEQRLAFRADPTVELGGTRVFREEKQPLEAGAVYRPVPVREGAVPTGLRAYEQTGRGIVPIVYWVDGRGQLLFVLSGLIGYTFNAEAQV